MEKRRLQFDFTEEAVKELDDLQKLTGFPTRAELIRHALRFLQWTVRETVTDRATLLIEKNGKVRQIVFPFWNFGGGNQEPNGDNDSSEGLVQKVASGSRAAAEY
jgi:Arc/MetJ-type ribon-helix-helix transcriptional regulator